MTRKVLFAIMISVLISACSKKSNDTPDQGAALPANLPPKTGEVVTVSGNMSFWFYEGSGGCFGTLEADGAEIQLWTDVDLCGDRDYEENEKATLRIKYREDNQYGPDTIYTVVGFR